MKLVDVFRTVTLVLTFIAAVRIIPALWERVPTGRAWLIIAVLELQFTGSLIAVADSWGEPLIWWRTPRIFVATVFALAYIELVHLDHRRSRSNR